MHEIPPHVSYQDAALVEPLACVLRGLDETGIAAGDNVAVIGLGPIGLMFVRLAKAYGARVIAIGRRKTQLDRAAAMGADELLISGDYRRNRRRTFANLTEGRGADIAIEAVGTSRSLGNGGPAAAARRHRQLLRRLPQRQPHQPGHVAAALFRDHLQGQLPSHAGPHPQARSTSSAAASSPPRDFVNRVEPLTNLLEVMRHLMSHNGHMKTAIIP